MMFTRTLTTYKATAYKTVTDLATKTATVQEIGEVQFVGTTPTKTDARRAFQEEGIALPKGTEIEIVELKKELWGCTIEEFLEVATLIGKGDGEAASEE